MAAEETIKFLGVNHSTPVTHLKKMHSAPPIPAETKWAPRPPPLPGCNEEPKFLPKVVSEKAAQEAGLLSQQVAASMVSVETIR